MKRLIFIMAVLLMPLCIQAQRSSLLGKKSVTTKVDNSAYEKEQIVETDGKVTFRTTLNAEGKTKAELYALVGRWAAFRYEPSTENGVWTDDDYFRNLEYACIKTADPNAGTIECLGDEEMVFSNKVLAKDYCRVNYTLNIHVADGTPRKAYQLTRNQLVPSLREYVENHIIPRYAFFDKAHGETHVRQVIQQSMELATHYPVSLNMTYVIAAYHDTGLTEGRETHHIVSGRIIRADRQLRNWFMEEEIEMMAGELEKKEVERIMTLQ